MLDSAEKTRRILFPNTGGKKKKKRRPEKAREERGETKSDAEAKAASHQVSRLITMLSNSTSLYHSTPLIRGADGLGFFGLSIILVAYSAYTMLLARRHNVSKATNLISGLILALLIPFFWAFILDLSLLNPSLGVLLLVVFFTLISEFAVLWLLIMLANGWGIVFERLAAQQKARIRLLGILGGIILFMGFVMMIVGFAEGHRLFQERNGLRRMAAHLLQNIMYREAA